MFPYIPRPHHQLIPVCIMLMTAVVTGVFPSWQTGLAFVFVAIICLVTGIWIAAAGTLEKYTDYWDKVGEDIKKLKDTPPELWGALGFVVPPSSVTVKQVVTGEPGESPYYASKTFNLSLSPEKMQVLADALLTRTKTLAEGEWANTVVGQAKIREVKHEMLRAGLIRKRNPRNAASGFMLTERGVAYLYQYASDWVKADSSLEVMLSRVASPPPLAG